MFLNIMRCNSATEGGGVAIFQILTAAGLNMFANLELHAATFEAL